LSTRERGAGEYRYRPAWWLPGAHAQTLWGRFFRTRPALPLETEVLRAPDGDNIEIHTLKADPSAPHVLVLHGLEGTLRSHYVGGLLGHAHQRGWGATIMMHRGCGSAENVARRFYHSGETSDLAHTWDVVSARAPEAPWYVTGVSLGGNVLLKWLGERGTGVDRRIRAAAAVSVPFDLDAGARFISQGFSRVYDRTFVKSLKEKALAKLVRYPDLFDRERLERADSIYAFDDCVTAPVHGFANASDYYGKSSSLGFLPEIRVPTLLLSSRDDPFLPREVLARVESVATSNARLMLEFTDHGGHVGFIGGTMPWSAFYYAEWRVFRFFEEMEAGGRLRYD
jgi:predicted alpha/beta-fold hydrolase